MTKLRRSVVLVVVVAAVVTFLGFRALTQGDSPEKIPLDRYTRDLDRGKVASATIHDKDHTVTGKLSNGTEYTVNFPAQYTARLTQDVVDAGVDKFDTDHQSTSTWLSLLYGLLPFVLLALVLMWVLGQVQGGGGRVMRFGKAKAKTLSKDQPKTTFADVAGLDEAVEELEEIKEFLESPARFQQMGAKIPKGVLLYGPPGTGKTLLAKAVAGEAGVPFFSISGSDFVEMFVGVGASRVRDLFEQAKAAAPAIIFVDEIDAVGRQRGAGLGGGHDEREQTLNQLLVEMDGFDQKQGVILLASTNRPDILDPALLRPGRFDRQIVVDRPDLEGRKAILAVHGKEKPLAPGVDLDVIARRTPGFTGADLANLMNEAALLSARHNLKLIGLPQLEEAIDRVMAGPERRSRLISEREKRVIAYHEGGHALVAHALPNTDPVHKISIIPRGRALGYTLTLPTEDKFLVRRSELVDELAMLLGGRTAEELIFADPTTGAQNDIDRATTIARQMVTEYGMSDSLGPMRFGHPQGEVFLGRDFTSTPDYSDEVASRIDGEVRVLIDGAHAAALQVLIDNREILDRLARELIVHETLEAERVQELFADVRMWDGTGDADALCKRPTRAFVARAESQPGRRGVSHGPDPALRRLGVTDTTPLHFVPDPDAMTPINRDRIERAVREILEAIGEDPDRDGLVRTPTRIAKMYEEIFAGLHEDPSHHLTVTFEADHDEMVMVRDIPVHSMCEHHLVPFAGRAHVAYIPGEDGRITGLSKIARLVDGFAKRPQVQERLTTQIADALVDVLAPSGVLVMIEAEHFCMSMRGVKKPGSLTITSAVRGLFKSNAATRAEAMSLITYPGNRL